MPKEKIYKEIGLQSLQQRLRYRKLYYFFKIYKSQCPKYHFDIIPQSNCHCRTRNAHNIPHINVKHQIFKNSYFQATIIEWNKLDSNIRNSETLNIFKPKILKFIRPTASSIFCCQFSWFLLSFHNYSDERLTLLCQIRNINPDILRNNNIQVNQFFLYGDKNFTVATNFKVLSSTIEYILATKRFDESLFH